MPDAKLSVKNKKQEKKMKYGTAYKNLTDAIVLVAAFVAIICIVLAGLAFDGPTTVEDKKTGEKISIESVMDDPEVKAYTLLGVVFIVTAMLGFMVRQWYVIPIVASAVSVFVSMKVFLDGTLEKVAYAFVLLGLIGLVGNILYAVVTTKEKKEKISESAK